MDTFPILSQVKSLVQVICGDEKGALQTQLNFRSGCIVVSQVYSLCQLIDGDSKGAEETQKHYLRETKNFVNGTLDSTPGVGHLKGAIHYIAGDKEGGDRAMKSASRTVGVIGGGIGGMIVGGPPGAFAGGIYGGVAMDTLITVVDSKINQEDRPHGVVAGIARIVEGKSSPGEVFDLTVGVAMDGLKGVAAGKTYQEVKATAEAKAKLTKQVNNFILRPEEYGELVKIGPLGEKTYYNQGLQIYTKVSDRAGFVERYVYAEKAGFGVKVVGNTTNAVFTKPGMKLQNAIQSKLLTPDQALKLIDNLQSRLKDLKISHTDLKMDNLIYDPISEKVLTIDNGDWVPFGGERLLKTAGENATLLSTGEINPTGVCFRTDAGGFKLVREQIKSY